MRDAAAPPAKAPMTGIPAIVWTSSTAGDVVVLLKILRGNLQPAGSRDPRRTRKRL
jgi:hypothetical protein